jgi:hypothetical protein
MHSRRPWLTTVFFAVLSLMVLSSGCSPVSGDGLFAWRTGLFVSVVPKGQLPEKQLWARLATEDSVVIVSSDASGVDAREARRVFLAPGEELYLVEARLAGEAPLEGELFRIASDVIVAKLPEGLATSHWPGRPELHAVAARDPGIRHWRDGRSGRVSGESSREFFRESFVMEALTENLDSGGDVSLELPPHVDQAWLALKTRQLSGEELVMVDGREVRLSERGSEAGRRNARAWLAQQWRALGFTVTEQVYTTQSWAGARQGVNLVAELRAGGDGPEKWFLVTAHLDSVRNPGADDNGSGIVAALAVAEAVAHRGGRQSNHEQGNTSLRLIAFDEEELGLVGSAAYVRAAREGTDLDQIVGVLNLEMLGWDGDGDGAVHIIDCNEGLSPALTRVFEAALPEGELTKVAACTNRSDHASFWNAGVPAIVVSQNFFGGDANPCYHRACDTTSDMSFDYMQRFVRAMVEGTGDVLGLRGASR